MKLNNALIIGENTVTNAVTAGRVCPDGYYDVVKFGECRGDKIFISTILESRGFYGEIIDYCFEKKPEIIVCAGDDLYDSGVLEARYHLSPVMFLHKIGLLGENCKVAGGICFDRDDAELMAMTGSGLIVCPTYSCGTGRGIPLVTPALGKIKVQLGTFDNSFNTDGDILAEAKTLLLGTCSVMRKRDAIAIGELARMAGADDEETFEKLLKIKKR